ncbi:metallophosphoesterase family protein [Variovorax ureilyticus]|uniref:Metallophosphoesterase family protein n=1 Tax=Variovorax ureilyticus TaxID=1836198 RepID=A0ABU8VM21_9BURK
MRILLVSDLHYALRQLDWVVSAAPDYDLVVLAGDHMDVSSPVSLDTQSLVLLRYFSLANPGRSLVVASGNHDLTGADPHGERAALWLPESRRAGIAIDGDSLMLGDTLVTVCPWWDGPAGRATLEAQLAADAQRRPARWVWIYHWPPMGSPTCWTGKRHYGDADVAGWIAQYQPDFVLTGHVHEPPFKPTGAWADRIGTTWVFNPGRQIGPVPAHIVIDLDEGTASWHSLMGEEALQLGAECAPARSVF